MKRFFVLLALVAFLAPAFANAEDDGLKVSPFLRFKLVNDSVANQTYHDFDLSGIEISKKVTDNLSVKVTPGFFRKSLYGVGQAAGTDNLDFVLVEGYFSIGDLTKGYGDQGINLMAGQYEQPFYTMEEYYQPFRFIYRPIDYKLMENEYVDLGVMASKSFFDNAINLYLGYLSGVSWMGEYTVSPNNDNINAGGVRLVASFFPFKKFCDCWKDLSLTFNLKSIARTDARSNYNFLLGYKYERLSTSLEYLKTYSTVKATDIQATSFGISYDVWGPFQALGRWDYSDNKSAANQYDHLFLIGMNTKWFDGKLQAAVTYDQDYDPKAKVALAKRVMVATQFHY